MSYRSDAMNECRVYVGNLPPDIRSRDIDDVFYKYGKINHIDLKNQRGPPFCFVEFDDSRDAKDAVRGRDGYDFDGYKLRVELSRGRGPGVGYRGVNNRKDFGRDGRGTDRDRGDKYHRAGPKRSDNRVLVSGLPPSGSWQDLKDHMREAGDICYADVFKDGTGIVEFINYDDMKYAIKKLDDTKFRSHEGETSYITVKDDSEAGRYGGGSRSRQRSRSVSLPRRGRGSPSYSPMRRSNSPAADY